MNDDDVDDAKPCQIFMNEGIACENYLLWLTPSTNLMIPRWTMPICRIPALEITLNDLFGTAFDM